MTLDLFNALADLPVWPDCATSGCENKVCTWGSESLCYVHEERIVGRDRMLMRYDLTHEHPHWAKAKKNLMVALFKDIRDMDGI